MEKTNLTEEDWKIVESRLKYDIDNNIGMDLRFCILNKNKEVKQEENEKK